MPWNIGRSPSFLRVLRILGLLCLGGIPAAGSGCAIFEKCSFVLPKDTYEPVDHIVVWIPPFIYFEDNTIHPGMTVPCLKGRVYLMGEDKATTTTARGGYLGVEMFDTTSPNPPGVPPKRIAAWKFEQAALKQMQSADKIGVGYTLFLPFVEYSSAIKEVAMRVTYVDEKGQPREDQNKLTLRVAQEQPVVQVQHLRNVPVQTLMQR